MIVDVMVRSASFRLVAAAFALAVALTALFALLETAAGEPPAGALELAVDFAEALILGAAMFASAAALRRIDLVEGETRRLSARVAEAARAGAEWRRQSQLLLQGLGEAVAAQFRAWDLTPAEAEVAALMLRGMSTKEIARSRRTSAATIRQQAQAVYRKSGLGGRAELAAFFLEDVFGLDSDAAGGPEARPAV